MPTVVAGLRFEVSRGFWVLRATAESAFLLSVLHFVWRMNTGVLLAVVGDHSTNLAAIFFRLADALSLLLSGLLISLAVGWAHRDLVRRRDALFESFEEPSRNNSRIERCEPEQRRS